MREGRLGEADKADSLQSLLQPLKGPGNLGKKENEEIEQVMEDDCPGSALKINCM